MTRCRKHTVRIQDFCRCLLSRLLSLRLLHFVSVRMNYLTKMRRDQAGGATLVDCSVPVDSSQSPPHPPAASERLCFPLKFKHFLNLSKRETVCDHSWLWAQTGSTLHEARERETERERERESSQSAPCFHLSDELLNYLPYIIHFRLCIGANTFSRWFKSIWCHKNVDKVSLWCVSMFSSRDWSWCCSSDVVISLQRPPSATCLTNEPHGRLHDGLWDVWEISCSGGRSSQIFHLEGHFVVLKRKFKLRISVLTISIR